MRWGGCKGVRLESGIRNNIGGGRGKLQGGARKNERKLGGEGGQFKILFENGSVSKSQLWREVLINGG